MSKSKRIKSSPWFGAVLDSLRALPDAVCDLEGALREGGTRWHVSLKDVRAAMAQLRAALRRAEADLTPGGSPGEVDALRICDTVLARDLSTAPLLLNVCASLRHDLDADFDELATRMGVNLDSSMTNAEAAQFLNVKLPWICKLKKKGTLVAAGPARVERLSVFDYEQRQSQREDEKELRKRR